MFQLAYEYRRPTWYGGVPDSVGALSCSLDGIDVSERRGILEPRRRLMADAKLCLAPGNLRNATFDVL